MASETSSSVTGTMFGQELVRNGVQKAKVRMNTFSALLNCLRRMIKDSRFGTPKNNLVMSWLINAMDTEIGQNFLFYDTAHAIWMAAKETYSDSDNTADLFDIKGALHDLRQEGESLEPSLSPLFEKLSQRLKEKKAGKADDGNKAILQCSRRINTLSQGSTNIQEGTALVSRGSTYDARQKKGRPMGVIIAADQVTPKKHVGKYIGSPLAGSQTRRKRHEHLWQILKGKKEVPMILLSLAKNKWSGCKRCLAKDHPLTPLSQPDPLLREVPPTTSQVIYQYSMIVAPAMRIIKAAGKQDSQAHHVSFSTPDPRTTLGWLPTFKGRKARVLFLGCKERNKE
ncbi:hypothetical protein CK203_039262 [Vitis vinifera]|uniref:Uncharacterized protein n=1 Tax=Vitis vinifera TaxID=29760 RepID=A0A438HGP9_VITVI|nr:hypothetical protein CK203_039262 [Vitis vinifera]